MGLAILFICFFLILLVVHLGYWYGKNKRIFDFAKKYSGPPFIPFLGNAYVILPHRIDNALETINLFLKNYSLPVNIWIGHNYYYMNISAPEIKIVLNNPNAMDKGMVYKDFNIFYEESLIQLPYAQWKLRRRLTSRCFKMSTLKSFVPIFNERNKELLAVLKSPQEKDFNIFHLMDDYLFKTFTATAFGMDPKTFPNASEYAANVMKIQAKFGQRILDPIFPTKLWLKIHPNGRKVSTLVKRSQDLLKMAFARKRVQMLQQSTPDYDDNHNSNMCLLELLMKEETVSEEAMLMELALFTAAGIDTTGHTLGFCLTLLGMHPEIQAKVYDEVMSVMEGREYIDHDDVTNLKYTEQVILESLRCFPPAPIIARYTTADIDLGDKIVPKGSNIIVSIFHIHRSPKYWSNPDIFNPDRFLPENIDKVVPYSFLPFSLGPRDCIGKTYSMIQIKITIANIVRSFIISSHHKSVNDFKLTSCVALNTKEPVDCTFRLRE